MADKRYYWLKLKEDYFNSPKIKKLRKIAGGDTYTIIYLKMQLLSISNGGIIAYENIEPTFEEELALKLDEDLENVQITLSYIKAQAMVEENENEYLFLEATKSIGSEGQSAERVRKFRENHPKALQCNECVTRVKQNSISISNSNSISISNKDRVKGEGKHKYGEYQNVLLTDSELQKLNAEYGEQETKEAIKYLDEYLGMKGTKYKSHYLVMKNWVYKAVNEHKPKPKFELTESEKALSKKLKEDERRAEEEVLEFTPQMEANFRKMGYSEEQIKALKEMK